MNQLETRVSDVLNRDDVEVVKTGTMFEGDYGTVTVVLDDIKVRVTEDFDVTIREIDDE